MGIFWPRTCDYWLVGPLVRWLVGSLVGWFVGWLVVSCLTMYKLPYNPHCNSTHNTQYIQERNWRLHICILGWKRSSLNVIFLFTRFASKQWYIIYYCHYPSGMEKREKGKKGRPGGGKGKKKGNGSKEAGNYPHFVTLFINIRPYDR